MSRGQSSQVFGSATGNSATDQTNAQSAFGSTQNSINNYSNALSKFSASNPYTQGGEYDKDITTGLANTSDAGANSLAGALSMQAKRTGQNSAADAAAAASNAQQNTRNLSSDLAQAEQQRISSEAAYNQTGLQATATPISANQALYGTSVGAANSALGTAEQAAAAAPSFWDQVSAGLTGGLSKGLSYSPGNGNGPSVGVCFIAAELYGGWYDPRTVLIRIWLHTEFSQHRLGRIVVTLYMQFGERTAGLIRRYPLLRKVFLPMFDAALVRATAWDQSSPAGDLSTLIPTRQVQAKLRNYQEFELALGKDVGSQVRSQIIAYLLGAGYDVSEPLAREIAVRLLAACQKNALFVAKRDELCRLPHGEESRQRRLALCYKAAQTALPSIVHSVLANPDAKPTGIIFNGI
jgi:hypothetical protein